MFAAVLLVSSLLSAVYFFRVLEQVYFTESPPPDPDQASGIPPLSWRVVVPVLTLGAAVLLIGLFNGALVTSVIQPALPEF